MLSMTGYGRGEYKEGGIELTVEIKTVNNRYLDVAVKSPRIFAAVEEKIRSVIRGKLTRGHADVFISLSDKREREKTLYLDENVAKGYVAAVRKIEEMFPDAVKDLSVSSIVRYPDVLRAEEAAGLDDEIITALDKALNGALENLNAMRKVEGEKLKEDMLSRVATIETLVEKISERAPLVSAGYKEKLEAKMKKILESEEVDEARLLTEVAIFVDKSNIDEELTRLRSHVGQFREISKSEIVGRKLDFLVQEFNREANTICSKSNDVEITRLGLDCKNEIEKVREQVQNVE